MNLAPYWKARQGEVEASLNALLPKEKTRPATIHKAMRYSIFAGGKRLRPILTLAASEAISGKYKDALPLACAVECIHTYSLIHDDLPCMDNDDLRRGKPTSHKVFGEGIAVLAGDALLTIAFEMTAKAKASKRYNHGALVLELAEVSGSQALIGGQVADTEGEGKKLSPADLRYIHENKTAALITGSLRLGAMSANATEKQLAAITEFGQALGLAFQVIDDILDCTQTSEQLGKSAGKDIAAQKATYPSILGMDKAVKEAARLTKKADDALKIFGVKGETLRAIAGYMLERKN
ncbi:geranylgeranyl diphosphate synthase, type II [Verrucomicrobium sp. GAS474]|uniref:polyprenyl synthetase family protein n=1 Tax=Verrucomicrobium sp. GAS474 TaxID=1882831 RepID=UPI00087D019F|nr:farnesyl diphosphate synthase [Verrucomicrobium sp. GAS474]SDU23748.1 geranylgeranyl diphosphate synthase, type II [Verrucomicrobium sp. GAS474]